MPEIARFFGIVIRMYAEPKSKHHRPHFHAYYQGHVAIVALDPIQVIGGGLPRKQGRLVEAWAEIRRAALGLGTSPGSPPAFEDRARGFLADCGASGVVVERADTTVVMFWGNPAGLGCSGIGAVRSSLPTGQ